MNSYSELLEYLSEKTGIPVYDEIDITLDEYNSMELRPPLWIKVDGYEYQVSRKPIKGGTYVFKLNLFKQDSPLAFKEIPLDYPLDKMFYKIYRTHEDFNIPIKIIKNTYKDSEGGGWYSMKDIYEIDGKQFVKFN